ncbi:tRNA wybutosine-synthesizing protein 4-like [Biomphalaria glabrata]|uniref:tRNA wybutosine-synthesizing protein 4 n=1 Tax=Biomphalaria glabrata TaxID=6526 RepID=A0A9W2ZSR6_BIOGL|nr:tRNA wybutosine-synthesizing protein 4-like [Biomphalaria glabrata]XP_055877991.1 tRNA wybutosine-synthesizing protein 4-like [Biomphalaria glabrata]XP_055878000.1 tRNA wybutosine-synthesizing protein 4-like [Biomphalaria glabrata]
MDENINLLRKTNKTRRETAVQGTNDSSIVSKCSTSTCGYFNDPYLHYFVSKQSRRAPLIHRGYYIRAVAFDRILKSFLELYKNSKKQVISLGCGFDSTYFRLKSCDLLQNTVFCEIDFPEVVKKKRLLVENNEDLLKLVEKIKEQPLSPHIELSSADYHLLGVDLTQLNTLEAAIKMCGLEFDIPTLLLSECVMTYMTRRCSTELVKWASETFEEAIFGMYEQINPEDSFGLFMQNHFYSIGSPLKCINAFPSIESQRKRFLNTGWVCCEVYDMNTFYSLFVDDKEKRRIESLETFDEYEELNLKYSHYFILTASTVELPRSLITYGHSENDKKIIPLEPAITGVLSFTYVPDGDQSLRRFGHASSQIYQHYTITTGGFGEIDGRHQRLAEITVTDGRNFKSCHVLCCSAHIQYSRMHHTSVPLSNGITYLFGGRQSPYFMCNQMLKLILTLDKHKQSCPGDIGRARGTSSPIESDHLVTGNGTFQGGDLEQCNHSDDGQRNHSIDSIKHCDSNCDCCNSTFSWDFELGTLQVNVVAHNGKQPRERWRHAAVAVITDGKEKLFIHGGKTKTCDVLGDCHLFDPETETWEEVLCSGDVPGPRHSHCVTFWNGNVLLTGGLDIHHEPVLDVFRLDIGSRVWYRMNISGTFYPRYSHTAHLLGDFLILVGGVNTYHPPPGVAFVNLKTSQSMEFALPSPDKTSLMMLHRHTSILLDDQQLVVLGGGGNCFSFGTHLNRTPVLLNISQCMKFFN